MLKKGLCEFRTPKTTDQQLGILTIIPNEQAVSERHRNTFTMLQSRLTDSGWIQLIHLIKQILYKREKNTNN